MLPNCNHYCERNAAIRPSRLTLGRDLKRAWAGNICISSQALPELLISYDQQHGKMTRKIWLWGLHSPTGRKLTTNKKQHKNSRQINKQQQKLSADSAAGLITQVCQSSHTGTPDSGLWVINVAHVVRASHRSHGSRSKAINSASFRISVASGHVILSCQVWNNRPILHWACIKLALRFWSLWLQWEKKVGVFLFYILCYLQITFKGKLGS